MARHLREEQIRSLLRSRGFQFCDDGFEFHRREVGNAANLGHEIALRIVESSTCDHEEQAIDNTLYREGEGFWSSTGDDDEKACEHLIYQLLEPCCRIRAFGLAVYRAVFQYGSPIYPPKSLKLSVGMHPDNLWPVGKNWQVEPTSDVQEFVLPDSAPPAKFIKVHLEGKRQKQMTDDKYYHAIRHVYVKGHPLSAAAIHNYNAQRILPLRDSVEFVPGRNLQQWLKLDLCRGAAGAEPAEGDAQTRQPGFVWRPAAVYESDKSDDSQKSDRVLYESSCKNGIAAAPFKGKH